MVMRNQHDGAGSSEWWDDLPPKIRSRFGTLPADDPAAAPDPPAPARPAAGPSVFDWVRELSRLALLFLAVAIGNIVFLLIALSFLAGGPPVPFTAPGR
ncbi:MAG: hypothetical protein JWO38_7514 [Gemmataceae bacterium]|nr:hypothetical protein [Gemmataceae bacterium]